MTLVNKAVAAVAQPDPEDLSPQDTTSDQPAEPAGTTTQPATAAATTTATTSSTTATAARVVKMPYPGHAKLFQKMRFSTNYEKFELFSQIIPIF